MAKKKKSTLLTRLFGNRNKVTDFMTEEQLQSPGRLILKNFLHNRLGMTGLIVFLLIFLLVMIGPKFYTLDLSYQDNTQLNVAPGMNMMKIPDGMKHKVADISPGTTYGVGVDTDGKVYIWGYTRITDTIDLKNIPEEVQNAKIVNVAAGYDHIVALDENGAIYVWGNKRLGQDSIPDKLQMAAAYGKNLGIKQIEASNQFSAAVTEDGELFLWGNGNQADIKIKKEYQGNIEKVALTARAYVALTKDGAVVYSGFQKDNALVRIPEGLDSGVVDIAASSNAVAAVKEDGTVVVWGTCTNGENNVPAFESKPVELYGGRYHFTALMDDGEVISWGDNTHGQASVPASFNEKEIVTVYAGFYQNYAVTVNGDVETWGLKGYVCGTDDLGRDVFNRLINGGKVTMTVGAISHLRGRRRSAVPAVRDDPLRHHRHAHHGRAAYVPHHGRAGRLVLAGHLPSDPRADPLAARAGIRDRRTGARCAREEHHLPSHHPECHEPHPGQRDAELCDLHAHRVLAVLHGLRHRASHTDLGQHAHRREQLHRHPAVLVALGLPGCDLRHLHDLHQPCGRRAA